jgi:hypothetical protein
MNGKYATPYRPDSGSIWNGFSRYRVGNRYTLGLVYSFNRDATRWYHTENNSPFRTAKEAKTDLDRCLITQGYTLLTEEQLTRLEVLL